MQVRELIDDIYMTHQVLIAPHLEFLKEVDNTPLEINVDRERLIQVLTNFLNNAGKFTETGYIKLGYSYLPDEGKVQIYVEDTGRGIPREEQRMIFSRFYKQNEFSQGSRIGAFYLSGDYREAGWKDRTQVRGRQGKSLYGHPSLPGSVLIKLNRRDCQPCYFLFFPFSIVPK